jgi:peptide deformylase
MTILKLIYHPDVVFKKISKNIDNIDKIFAYNMLETMYHNKGIGMAAIQVGNDIRMMVMDVAENGEKNPLILINPEIVELSQDLSDYSEGNISMPDVYVSVTRANDIKVKYLDIDGNKCELNASGIEARCIMHQIEQMDGRSILDYLSNTKRMITVAKLNKIKRKK